MSETRSLTDKFMLRLPDGMRERIKASAERNGRSMNSEIVAVLEREFPPPPPEGIDLYAESLKVTLGRLDVKPPKGMTINDVVKVVMADLMLENTDLEALGEKLKQEAIDRQNFNDAAIDDR